jgi:hypothetical protein
MRAGSFRLYNKGIDPRRIQIGQKLVIPPKSELLINGPRVPKGLTWQPNLNFLMKIAEQETSSGANLFGDERFGKPHAVGLMQILEVPPNDRPKYLEARKGLPTTYSRVIDDVNDHWGTNYNLKSRYSYSDSLNIANKYLKLAAINFYNKFGRNPTDEEMYRAWNGGREWYAAKPSVRDAAINYSRQIMSRKNPPPKLRYMSAKDVENKYKRWEAQEAQNNTAVQPKPVPVKAPVNPVVNRRVR